MAGATGAVGSHAVLALVDGGHEVTAVARTDEKAATLRGQGATPVRVSIFDPDALTAAFAGVDAVVKLATAIPPLHRFMSTKAWAANDRVRMESSAALVEATGAAGVERFVQESVVMIYRDGGKDWIDEDWPTDGYPMARGNLAAEASAERVSQSGGVGVVLRFGWFCGPGATHSEQFLSFARHHVCVQMGRPDTYVSSIHMADAGAGVAASLHIPAGTYNLVDDEPLTKRAYADALAGAAKTRPWLRYPGRLALAFGDRSTPLTRSVRASNRRFKEATGWTPTYPSAREGWPATAAALPQVTDAEDDFGIGRASAGDRRDPRP